MAKSELTKKIELATLRYVYKMSNFSCNEVGIVNKVKKPSKYNQDYLVDKYDTEIVDVMTYDQNKDIFRCYEIKISKSDFKSKNKVSFVGNYNYYVIPVELFKEIKDNIPKNIGVLVYRGYSSLDCIISPKKQELQYPKDKLLISMVKSLNRVFYDKVWDCIRNNKLLKEEGN
jgi:hypothetical protein